MGPSLMSDMGGVLYSFLLPQTSGSSSRRLFLMESEVVGAVSEFHTLVYQVMENL